METRRAGSQPSGAIDRLWVAHGSLPDGKLAQLPGDLSRFSSRRLLVSQERDGRGRNRRSTVLCNTYGADCNHIAEHHWRTTLA
jgi:hypothetical protein